MTPRGYLTDTHYMRITNSATLGADAETLIGHAETIIDGYLGNWQPAIGHYKGVASAATATNVTLALEHQRLNSEDLLAGCVIEFLTGTGAGLFRLVKNSTAAGLVTFDTPMDAAPQAGDVYHIYQMGKVPRAGKYDITTLKIDGGWRTLRTIPAPLTEAVAWQVAYMQEMGADYFNGNALNLDSENFGSYSYTKSDGAKGGRAIIAPQAKQTLSGSGLINRTGRIASW